MTERARMLTLCCDFCVKQNTEASADAPVFPNSTILFFLFQPDLLGVFLQQLPLKEGGLDALAVAVGLVPLADDGD